MRVPASVCVTAIWFFFIGGLFQPAQSQLTDRQTLETLYASCNGNDWTKNTNWLDANIGICDWHGITCTSNGNVRQIKLRDNNLACALPHDLFYISTLKVVDLSRNQNLTVDLTDIDSQRASGLQKIFISDANWQSLNGLDAAFNSTLTVLGAAGNLLTGTFPDSVLQLTQLQHLDLSFNFLSGTIPEQISDLSQLQILSLSHNLLSGTIPTTIGTLTRLSQLFLQNNQLTGVIPTELGQLTRLAFLSLNNQILSDGVGGLTGPLIDFSNCPELFSLSLSNNHLSGTVPPSLLESVHSQFSSFLSVDFSGNDLTGVVPPELSRFQQFRLYLIRNKIDGVDSQLCSQSQWFRGEVGEFGCNAILCPPGTFGVFGRQISNEYPCNPCETAGFFGQSKCEPAINQSPPLQTDQDAPQTTNSTNSQLDASVVHTWTKGRGSQQPLDFDSETVPVLGESDGQAMFDIDGRPQFGPIEMTDEAAHSHDQPSPMEDTFSKGTSLHPGMCIALFALLVHCLLR